MKILLAGCLAYSIVWCVVFIAAYGSKRRGWLLATGGATVTLVTALAYLHSLGEPLSYQVAMSLCAAGSGAFVAVTHPLELLFLLLEGLGS